MDIVAERLVDRAETLSRDPDFDVRVTGDAIVMHDTNLLSERDLQQGELGFGLPAALVILLLVVGTVVGALLPLLLALSAIMTALALAALVGIGFDLSVFLVNMVSGMGLALGVDYSLFVLSRYREERTRGTSRDASILTTGRTASRAVLFSGVTFVIALFGMLLVPTTVMRSLALGAILVGITSVAAALTLLPALLRLLGDRVDRLRVPIIHGGMSDAGEQWRTGGWARLIRVVMRNPWPWALTTVVLLLAAASPLLGMHTGAGGVATLPPDVASRRGYEALQRNFPEATFAPARVVVTARDVTTASVTRQVAQLERAIAADDRFGDPTRTVAPDRRLLKLDIPVGADALDARAVSAVRDLRADLIPQVFADDGPLVRVTGLTAANVDYFDVMRDWVAPVFTIVLSLSFLVLLVVFRSIVVPLKAILLNLLSVGAAYGLLVLVFQRGVGADLLGFQQVDVIEAWIPLFLFSVLFGLSMDYHMFLLTRIRERWAHTGDTREAVEWGVSTTSRLITGAALIIVAVFTGFARGDLVMLQQMGFGIAVALFIDATIIRGVLLPATMVLLGDRNWYLPRWLHWLPRVELEH
jgi:RND superfamily putative drug exporter